MLDLVFPVLGQSVPTDHAYNLYAALSRVVPAFHDPSAGLRFAPITGTAGEAGQLRLDSRSHFRVRLPADAVGTILPLAGRTVEIAATTVRFGPPTVFPLVAAPTLESRLVTFKHGEEPEQFLATARAKLAELSVEGEPMLRVVTGGRWEGTPRRRVVRVKGRIIVGYAMVVSGLTADHSLLLQERGLGGRTQLGCGFFLPHIPRK